MEWQMSAMQFSVCLGHADREPLVSDLIESIVRVERGITALSERLRLSSHLELRRTICQERKEWINVYLRAGAQENLIDVLEASLGSSLTLEDIESRALHEQFQQAMSTLNTLCRSRIWTSNEFLSCISKLSSPESLKAITRHLPLENGEVLWRTMDGTTSKTKIPNRLFSARSDRIYRLTFLPREVGRLSATVVIDHESALLISAKNRSIKMIWSSFDELSPAQVLVKSALDEVWMTAVFHVTRNRHNQAKSLLLQNFLSLTFYDSLLKPAVVSDSSTQGTQPV